MATESRKQTLGHAQVDTNINAPGLVVAARPANFRTPNVTIDRQGPEGLRRIAQALGSFQPLLNKIAKDDLEETNEREFMLGKKARMEAGELDNKGYEDYLEKRGVDGGSAYARGFMSAHGRAQAHRAKRQLSEFVTDHSNDILTDEQFNSAVSTFLAGQLDGMEDADYLSQYLQVMEPAEAQMRDAWQKDQYLTLMQSNRDNFNEGVRGDLLDLATNDAPIQDIHTVQRAWYAQANVMGLSREAANEMVFENLREVAIETGRKDIFGEDDGDFGIFEFAGQDVDDPSKTIPGLAGSEKWQKRIHDARLKINSSIDTANNVKSEREVMLAQMSFDDAIRNEEWTKAEQISEGGVNSKYWSGIAGASKYEEVQKARDEAALVREATELTQQGLAHLSDNPKLTQKIRDKAWLKHKQEIMKQAGGDLQKMPEATQQIIESGFLNGRVDDQFKTAMTSAMPDYVNRWVPAYKLYQQHYKVNPQGTIDAIGTQKYHQFEMYETLLKSMPPENAMYMVASRGTEENMRQAQRILGEDRREHTRTIRNALDTGKSTLPKWFGLSQKSGTATDQSYVYSQVEKNALAYLAYSGQSAEEAIEVGVKQFEAMHRFSMYPGTDKGHWTYTGGRNLPPDYDVALADMSAELVKEYKGTSAEASGYYLSNNPIDPLGPMVLTKADATHQYVTTVKNGKVVPVTYDPLKVAATYRDKMKPSAEEVRAQHQAEQDARIDAMAKAGMSRRERREGDFKSQSELRREQRTDFIPN